MIWKKKLFSVLLHEVHIIQSVISHLKSSQNTSTKAEQVNQKEIRNTELFTIN